MWRAKALRYGNRRPTDLVPMFHCSGVGCGVGSSYRGRPMPRAAMMFRCTSEVPAPMVSCTVDR